MEEGVLVSTDHTCDVCVIDDDAAQRRLMVEVLSRQGYSCVEAVDGRSALELLERTQPKVVLSDWEMPAPDGLQLCLWLRDSPNLATTFFIMVTAADDPQRRDHALTTGADDYLVKPIDRSALLARVRVGLRMWEANDRLRKAAITDGLTGLYNHDYLTGIVERELHRARRYGGRLSLLMIDLDFFKAVNDTYGHLVGNQTLLEVARVLRATIRQFDTPGRFGGEEFAIVAPEADLDDAVAIGERIRRGIADTLQVPALKDHVVTASVGIACIDDARVRTASDLIDLADQALYAAKRKGRNRVATAFDVGDLEGPGAIEHAEVENLRRRVATLSTQAKEVYMQTIFSLLQALEEKDPFTARHSHNVAFYCDQLASAMNLSTPLVKAIYNAGLLHDVGKVGIPDRILVKPSALTETEQMVMQQVPFITVRIIDHLRILETEMHIIRHQREFFDGSGYPEGLQGEQIPIGARILLLANAFDALTTDRVYRPCRTIAQAIEEIERTSGKQFDPEVVRVLRQVTKVHRHAIQDRIRETAKTIREAFAPC